MSLNRVILIGRLTADPSLKYTPSGIPVANFTVAVDRNTAPNAQGEREADFVPCVAWHQSAEFAANYLQKGRLVACDGRLQIRKYQDKDGQNRTFTEVVCERLQGLDRAREGQDAPAIPDDLDAEDPFAG
jgi:single-strand DNA-binding protein